MNNYCSVNVYRSASPSILQDNNVTLSLSADELRRLNPFAVTFRYDDMDIPFISVGEVAEMVIAIRNWGGEIVQ